MHVLRHMTRSDAKGAAAAAPSVQLCGDIHPIALRLSELFSQAEVTETLDSKMKTRIKILVINMVKISALLKFHVLSNYLHRDHNQRHQQCSAAAHLDYEKGVI